MNENAVMELLRRSRMFAKAQLSRQIDDIERNALTAHISNLTWEIKEMKHGTNTTLACNSEEAHNQSVSEHDKHCLPEALHGLQVELVRTTGELKSLLLILSKLDLGNTEKIHMKISELAGGIGEVKTATLKALSEIRNRIDAADARIVILETQLADADIPPAAETALAELKTISKQLDDIVPDVPELPPVVTPPTPA